MYFSVMLDIKNVHESMICFADILAAYTYARIC